MKAGYTQDTEPRSHDNVKTLQQHNYKLTLEHVSGPSVTLTLLLRACDVLCVCRVVCVTCSV